MEHKINSCPLAPRDQLDQCEIRSKSAHGVLLKLLQSTLCWLGFLLQGCQPALTHLCCQK